MTTFGQSQELGIRNQDHKTRHKKTKAFSIFDLYFCLLLTICCFIAWPLTGSTAAEDAGARSYDKPEKGLSGEPRATREGDATKEILLAREPRLEGAGEGTADDRREDTKTVENLQKQIDARSKEIQRLEEEAKRYRVLVGQKAQEQKNLANQISLLGAEIQELTLRIRITETHIKRTQATVEELGNDIEEKERQIARTKEYIGALIQELNEKDSETLLTTLLRAPSLAVFSEELEYVLNLNQSVHERLTTLELLTNQLESEKKVTEEKKRDLEASQRELAARENVTEDRKEEHERLLTLTGKAKKSYEQTLKEIEQQQKAIQDEIVALESKLRQLLDPRRLPGSQPGLLAWPVRGTFSQGYGPTSQTGFTNDAYKFHNGIDIAIPSGTPVRAAYDGVVKAVGDNGKYAYGRWVAIEHGNGLTTLYAHFSGPAVSPGQKVSRGEVVGYSGSTGFSTGPHLHFTVYATETFKTEDRWFGLLPLGGSVNPLQYL